MNENTQQMMRLIETRHKSLVRLVSMAEEQLNAIESCDTSRLLGVLADKQPLIEGMLQSQQEFEVLQRNAGPQSNESYRVTLQRCAASCNELGRQLLALEAKCESRAQEKRDGLAKQIQEFSKVDSRSSDFAREDDGIHLAAFDESS